MVEKKLLKSRVQLLYVSVTISEWFPPVKLWILVKSYCPVMH